MPSDRRHTLNASRSLHLGRPARGGLAAVVLDDWNQSGISTFATGTPMRVTFSGDLASSNDAMSRAWWGTQDFRGATGAIAPVFDCDSQSGGTAVGDRVLEIGCIGIPAFGSEGQVPTPPFDIRSPSRSFHDLTVFEDFSLGGSRRLQLRIGIFNLFSQAYPDPLRGDVDLRLDTRCDVRASGVPNGLGTSDGVCDPQGGYSYTENTLENFGRIITKRGHRVIELALRLIF